MGYFDSPKNRALWEVELKRLREEKEYRSQHKGEDLARLKEERMERQKENPNRIRTSFQELLAEETRERQKRQTVRSMERSRKKEISMEKEEHQMKAPSLRGSVS